MTKAIGMAGAVGALLVAASTIAVAQTAETRYGVTVLRGGTPSKSGVFAGPGSGDPLATPNRGTNIDQSGARNALHTGSSNAGGENANPPPGAGR